MSVFTGSVQIFDIEGLQIKQIHIASDKEIIKGRKAIVEHPFGRLEY